MQSSSTPDDMEKIRSNAETLAADPARIIIGGGSAGANVVSE